MREPSVIYEVEWHDNESTLGSIVFDNTLPENCH